MIEASISTADCHESPVLWSQLNDVMTNEKFVIALRCAASTFATMIGVRFPNCHQWNNETYRFGSNGNWHCPLIIIYAHRTHWKRTTHSNTSANISGESFPPKTPTIDTHRTESIFLVGFVRIFSGWFEHHWTAWRADQNKKNK